MRIHILGVTTTFMTGIALLAKQAGHDVMASDICITGLTRRTLEPLGVKLNEGFHVDNVAYDPDLIIVGKEIESTNQELVAAKNRVVSIMTGSEWLEKYILAEQSPHKTNQQLVNDAKTLHEKEKHKSPLAAILDKPITKHAPKIPPESNSKLKRITR